MPEPIAYLNGQFLPAAQAAIPLYDVGFVQGVTVTEQLRTFDGKIFAFERHWQRLSHSLEIVGIDPGKTESELLSIAQQVVDHNRKLVDAQDDLGVSIFLTPGPYETLADGAPAGVTLGVHTYRLPFDRWAKAYQHGVRLVTTEVQQVPTECWPAELKCRSRMHYYLADRRAAEIEPGARALLLDAAAHVTETSTANLLVWNEATGFVTPPRSRVLPGITLQVTKELSEKLDQPVTERDLTVADLHNADEMILCSTPSCILPVSSLNKKPIGGSTHHIPGQMYQRLLSAWNELVGLDIAKQAVNFSKR
ncbi:MAG: aminotransferase class IV [Planctomycetota bacterium]|nr:aminotransferase class IV [Planctomycetota bacterium]